MQDASKMKYDPSYHPMTIVTAGSTVWGVEGSSKRTGTLHSDQTYILTRVSLGVNL